MRLCWRKCHAIGIESSGGAARKIVATRPGPPNSLVFVVLNPMVAKPLLVVMMMTMVMLVVMIGGVDGQSGGCCVSDNWETEVMESDGSVVAHVWYSDTIGATRMEVVEGGKKEIRLATSVSTSGTYINYVVDVESETCTVRKHVPLSSSFVALCFDASNPEWRIVDSHPPEHKGALVWRYVPQRSDWLVVPSPPCTPIAANGTWSGWDFPSNVSIGPLHPIPFNATLFHPPSFCHQ